MRLLQGRRRQAPARRLRAERAKPWAHGRHLRRSFEFDQLPADFDHFEPILATRRRTVCPCSAEAGIHTFFNGPESFTPDNAYHLGLAAGYAITSGSPRASTRSGSSPLAARVWPWRGGWTHGLMPFDLGDVDIARMSSPSNATATTSADPRPNEALGLLYADHFPFRQKAHRARRAPQPGARGIGR